MKLSIIIPVFNEDRTILAILEKVSKVRLPTNITKEIIVVDDSSTDSTSKILKDIQNINFKLISHKINKGKGASVRTGIKISSGDYIIIQDADLEYNPEDYSKLLEVVIKDDEKIVYGTRLKNYPLSFWGEKKTVLPLHLLANKFLTFLVNILFNAHLSDMETGYKLFSREVLEKMDLKSNRFDIEPEITIKALKLGYNIKEVEIVTRPRDYKEGKKIGFIDGLSAIWTIIKYRFAN